MVRYDERKENINFNSHAHVERDQSKFRNRQVIDSISTHTLTWSVTLLPLSVGLFSVHFNSHAHVEHDSRGNRR